MTYTTPAVSSDETILKHQNIRSKMSHDSSFSCSESSLHCLLAHVAVLYNLPSSTHRSHFVASHSKPGWFGSVVPIPLRV